MLQYVPISVVHISRKSRDDGLIWKKLKALLAVRTERSKKCEKGKDSDGETDSVRGQTRGVEQHKARKIETVEKSQQRAERLEVLCKTKAARQLSQKH